MPVAILLAVAMLVTWIMHVNALSRVQLEQTTQLHEAYEVSVIVILGTDVTWMDKDADHYK